MFRHHFTRLQEWLDRPDRKPLILRGARQVGKSTLVRLFAERTGRPVTEVNLERHPDLGPAFARNDPAHLLRTLEALPRVRPVGPRSLPFLDEIQAVPEAVPALRYLREVPVEVTAGASGSLKSLHQFVARKGARVAVRFDAAPPSVQTVQTVARDRGRRSEVRYRLISLPLYLVERLPAVLASFRG